MHLILLINVDKKFYQSNVSKTLPFNFYSSTSGLPIFKHESEELYMYSINSAGADYWFVGTKINGSAYKLLFIGDSSASNVCPNLVSVKLVQTGNDASTLLTDSGIAITSI